MRRSFVIIGFLSVTIHALGACVAEGCPVGFRASGGRCLALDAAVEAGDDIDAGSVDGGLCGPCPAAFPICTVATLRCVECERDTDCSGPVPSTCSAVRQCVPK